MKKIITKITAGVLSVFMLTTPVMASEANYNNNVDCTYGISKDTHYAGENNINVDGFYRYNNHSFMIDRNRPNTTTLTKWESLIEDTDDQGVYIRVKTNTNKVVDKIEMYVILEYYDDGINIKVDDWTITDTDTRAAKKNFKVSDLESGTKYRVSTVHKSYDDGECVDTQMSQTKWITLK